MQGLLGWAFAAALAAACASLWAERARLCARLDEYESLSRRPERPNTWYAEEAHALELQAGEDELDAKMALLDSEEARFPHGHWARAWEEHLERHTSAAFGRGRALDCSQLGSMSLSEAELRPGVFGDGHARRAAKALRECGVVYLDNLFGRKQLEVVRNAYEAFRRREDADAVWKYPVQGEGRIEYFLPFEEPFNDTSLYGDRRLLDVVRAFLGPQIKMELQTVIESLPGSKAQRYHQGWRYLFNPEERLPPYAVVVGIPLVDVSPEMGPTEVCPGKNLRFYRGWTCPEESVMVASTLGTAVVFDFKTLHRGPPNRSLFSRPMISLVFSRDWFVNSWAVTNHAVPLLQTLHQRRYWEQSFWHSKAPDKV